MILRYKYKKLYYVSNVLVRTNKCFPKYNNQVAVQAQEPRRGARGALGRAGCRNAAHNALPRASLRTSPHSTQYTVSATRRFSDNCRKWYKLVSSTVVNCSVLEQSIILCPYISNWRFVVLATLITNFSSLQNLIYRVICEYEFHRGTSGAETGQRINDVYGGRIAKFQLAKQAPWAVGDTSW